MNLPAITAHHPLFMVQFYQSFQREARYFSSPKNLLKFSQENRHKRIRAFLAAKNSTKKLLYFQFSRLFFEVYLKKVEKLLDNPSRLWYIYIVRSGMDKPV
jgi:hypothetical protein